ncbi:MAG: hypothetical protein ABEK50_07075, partial [bacterium]
MIGSVWWKSTLFWCLAVVAFYLLVGVLGVPPIVDGLLQSTVTTQTTLDPEVKTVEFDPITFTLRLGDLSLWHSGKPVLKTDQITINFDPVVSVYRWDWSFGNLKVRSPQITVVRDKSGVINWSQIYAPPSGPSENTTTSTNTPNVTLDRFRLL